MEDGSAWALRAAEFLTSKKDELGMKDLRIVTQAQYLEEVAQSPKLGVAERRALLDRTDEVLRNLYAHLPFKKPAGSNPLSPFQALDQIRAQVAELSDLDFHMCLLLALATVRDVHTSYTAPPPYQGAVAFLPFQIRFFEDQKGEFRFVLSKAMLVGEDQKWDHPTFQVGAEVVAWDGMPLVEATMVAAQLQPGANQDAELSRGTTRLTVRSIGSHGVAGSGGAPPFEPVNAVTIRYLPPGEHEPREIEFPWQVATGLGTKSLSSTAFSMSDAMTVLQRWSKCSYRPDKVMAMWQAPATTPSPELAPAPAPPTAPPEPESDFFEIQLSTDPPKAGFPDPQLLACLADPAWPIGYMRIRHFAGGDPSILEDKKFEQIKDALIRLDREACGGLILDIRGNPGGQIRLAERMLQLLTPRHIHPLQFHYPRTPVVTEVIELLRQSAVSKPEFAAWLEAQPGDDQVDPHLTPGRTITSESAANDTGQVYQGPVVLLFDALTYSAADMFAAGFQDHDIGELIGVDCSTGGGGANAWSYQDILDNVPPVPGLDLGKLPDGCALNVAVRRCLRTGPDKLPIEDLGVKPTSADTFHARTRRDVLEGNVDLFNFAYERLMAAPIRRIDVEKAEPSESGLAVSLATVGIEFVVFRAGDDVLAQGHVTPGETRTFTVAIPPDAEQLRVEGYCNAEEVAQGMPPLVAAPRITLKQERKPALSFLRTPAARASGARGVRRS